MIYALFFLFSLLYIGESGIVEDHVDLFELNHIYNNKGKVTFDQVIMWEWVENKEGTALVKIAVGWYSLPSKIYREKLTRAEFLKKNRKFGDKWVKKYGLNTFIPDYNPKFMGGIMCPRYDTVRNKWVVIYNYNKKINRIYSNSYIETWTQSFDPEIENRKILPVNNRRRLRVSISR